MGCTIMLKSDIWFERKAIKHYSKLLSSISWGAETRRVIEKDQVDEYEHVNRWRRMLK